MKKTTILFCLILSLTASATKVKRNFNLVVEDFRGFDNSTRKLGTTNDRYFTFSGPGVYGLGNNDNGKPIFTLYKNSRISVNLDQLKFFYPDYFDFNWVIVFKIPRESKFTVSDLAYKVDSQHIHLWPHRYNPQASNGYIFTLIFAEPMPHLNASYYIERTVFANYPYLDPLNIDTIYLCGHKMIDDGTDPEDTTVGLSIVDKKVKIYNPTYGHLKAEVRNFRGDIILSEDLNVPEAEFPLNVEPGPYIITLYSENRIIISKKIYIN